MKIASDEQRNIIKTMVYDIINQEPIDYTGLPANADIDKMMEDAMNGTLEIYENILNQESLSVTDQHAVLVSVLTKLVLERTILIARLLSKNKG